VPLGHPDRMRGFGGFPQGDRPAGGNRVGGRWGGVAGVAAAGPQGGAAIRGGGGEVGGESSADGEEFAGDGAVAGASVVAADGGVGSETTADGGSPRPHDVFRRAADVAGAGGFLRPPGFRCLVGDGPPGGSAAVARPVGGDDRAGSDP